MRCKLDFFDPLSTKLGIWDLDGWSVAHLVLFFVVGRAYPAELPLLFAYGAAWEIIEHLLGKSRPSWLGGWANCEENKNAEYNTGWWFGRISDLVVNGIGMVLGWMSLRRF